MTSPITGELGGQPETLLEIPLIAGVPELQHYYWTPSISGRNCEFCHIQTGTFTPANCRTEDAGFCYSCHNPASVAHEQPHHGSYSHSIMVNVTSSGSNRLPTYGNITSGEYNNQPFARLKDGKTVLCVTCHNVMRKTEDYGRVWEYTTTTDQLTYTLQQGSWSAYGYLVPRVYRDTSLWAGPTYSKDMKAYLVSPDEYVYNEKVGTVTFNTAQQPYDYIYVTLDYPYLRASSEENRLCQDCHTFATHRPVNNCLTCHRAHNTGNLAGIRDDVRIGNTSSVEVKFLSYTGANSFADGDTTYDGICEVCHTTTKYYTRDGSGFANHSGGFNYDGTDCTSCHSHEVGFARWGFDIKIVSPYHNYTTSEYSVMVKGTIIGRDGAEVGVTIGGLLAEVNDRNFALADVPLAEGVTKVTAVATDANGMTAFSSVNVNLVNPAMNPVGISASPSSGPAPLDVAFSIESNVPDAVLFELDYEGDGVPDASSTTFDGMTSFLTHTYNSNGLYYPKFAVTDNSDEVFEKSTVVNVKDLPDFIGMWNAMRAALVAGDVNKATMYMSLETREKSRTLYNTLASAEVLGQFASGLSDMQVINITPYTAEGDLRVMENGEEFSYYVLFVKDSDGIWRIHSY